MRNFILVLLFLLTLTFGCSSDSGERILVQQMEGVVLQKEYYSGKASLENTNPYPVRVRKVFQHHGERTLSMFKIQPGEKMEIKDHIPSESFYIYTMEGALVGWLGGRFDYFQEKK